MSVPPEDIALERQPFLPNPLVIIAAASHPLAGRKRLPLARLARARFILRKPGSGTRLACDAHFKRAGFVPDVRLEIGSNEAIKEAVAAGMGIAIVSRHALRGKSAVRDLAILGVAGFPLHSNWWVLYPRGKGLSPIAIKFFHELALSRKASEVDDAALGWSGSEPRYGRDRIALLEPRQQLDAESWALAHANVPPQPPGAR